MLTAEHTAVWCISLATIGSILFRPRGTAEWMSSLAGAAVLVLLRLLPAHYALAAVLSGLDVYLFLAGMLALAELARIQGVFEWLAARMVRCAKGSKLRLFTLIYGAGVVVTVLLSNDGTIALLTPAVLAILSRAPINPVPFLYACAFVANAASFVLPISNPANLLVFQQVPALGPWLGVFAPSAIIAILSTYVLLYFVCRRDLIGSLRADHKTPPLTPIGKLTLGLVSVAAALLILAAALGRPLGESAFLLAMVSTLTVGWIDRRVVRTMMSEGPWSIIPLVAGLFVVVEAVDRSGALNLARHFFRVTAGLHTLTGNLIAGTVVTLGDNLFNNLAVALLSRYTLESSGVPAHLGHATLVAVDLGPNLSLTGSLATLLWLIILRRNRLDVHPLTFLRMGTIVLLPTLILTMLAVR